MTLRAGTRLGPYEILSLLGAAGWARCTRPATRGSTARWRSKCCRTRLPLIRSSANASTARRARSPSFRIRTSARCTTSANRAARRSSSWSILDGETLADRLTKGALPLDEALKIAIQIADALDAAHRQGIVHRDLKPGNVMLTKAGAKLLDFGLAKASAPIAGAGLSMLPTTPPNLTAQGTILGTFQYMAPEQLEGQEADARTDIFAFGAVLYEMLTGRKAFEGKSQASLIGAILHTTPPSLASLQPLAPPSLDRIVATCLAKDPDDRWQSAADLVRELRWLASDAKVSAPDASLAVTSGSRTGRVGWILAMAMAIFAVLAVGFAVRNASQQRLPTRVSVEVPGWVAIGPNSFPRLSPDGRSVVFVGLNSQGTLPILWLRSLDSFGVRALSGTERGSMPFWSPDSRSIGFFTDDTLKRIDIAGGAALTLADARGLGRGGSWSPGGDIVFAPSGSGRSLDRPGGRRYRFGRRRRSTDRDSRTLTGGRNSCPMGSISFTSVAPPTARTTPCMWPGLTRTIRLAWS